MDDAAFARLTEAYAYDTALPLKAVTLCDWTGRNPYLIEKLRFTSTNGQVVPALFAHAVGSDQDNRPRPAVVLAHGYNRFWGKYEDWCLDFIDVLARAGYHVIVIDNPTFGERLHEPGRMFVDLTGQARAACLVQSVTDQRRAIDYLLTRPQVEPSRIVLLGGSLGGYFATFIAALEDRLAALVLTVTQLWDPIADADEPWRTSTDMKLFAPRIKVPVMMLNATGDDVNRIKALHELLPQPNRIVWKESGHFVPPKQNSAEILAWLSEQLG